MYLEQTTVVFWTRQARFAAPRMGANWQQCKPRTPETIFRCKVRIQQSSRAP